MSGLRHVLGRPGIHHILESQELLVEVVHGCPPVREVLLLRHVLLRALSGYVHRASPAPSVRECPGDPDGADRVHAVRILDYPPFQCGRGGRIVPFERDLRYDPADGPLVLGRYALRFHEHPGVGEPAAAEELAVVDIMQQSGQTDDVLIPAFLGAYRTCQIMYPDGMVHIMSAAVPLEYPSRVLLRPLEDRFIHDDRTWMGCDG